MGFRGMGNSLFPHTCVAQAATISTVDLLQSPGLALTLMSPSRCDTSQSGLAHTTFGDLPGLLFVLVYQTASRCPDTRKE